jgi:hypothetical protein
MGAKRVHDALKQIVPRRMAVRVVDGLQTDDVDVGNDEHRLSPAGTIDLVIEVRQSRPARSRPRQDVYLGDQQLVQQLGAICLCLQPVARRLLAIVRRPSAIARSPRSGLSCRGTVGSGTPPALGRALEHHRRLPAGCPGSVPHCLLAIMEIGRLIARRRSLVAVARDDITSGGGPDTGQSVLPALLGAVVAKVTRGVVHGSVAAFREIAIARRLIGVGSSLIAFG